MSDITNALELMPTHFCQTCGARWRQLDDGRWNLRSPGCEPCCDNGPTFNVMPLVMAYDALRGQLHDEIAANHAFRDAGGALPDEDMPTFCDRLIRERGAARAEVARMQSDVANMLRCFMKDHEIAALVNALRDIAIKYHGAQQLREQIAAVVVPALRGALEEL